MVCICLTLGFDMVSVMSGREAEDELVPMEPVAQARRAILTKLRFRVKQHRRTQDTWTVWYASDKAKIDSMAW